ncbi:MAG TPA: universal stress protein [Bryobacteraceae bacterium]|nr:universal stress protein [Bryobacteraceae bacterium]
MKTFRHILFPVDFSDRSEAARSQVMSWAQRFQAHVTLIHTIQIPLSAYGGPDGYPIIVDVPAIEAAAKERLDRVEFPGADRVVTMGDPAYEVSQFAEKHGVDLIMMATHGYGKFRGVLMGSVASKILHDAHCPVWTSAHPEDAAAPGDIRNVLCCIEAEKESAEMVRTAEDVAQAFGAELHLFHSGEGHISQAVRAAALEHKADLVITGAGKLHKALGRLRSNTMAIIHDSPCSVLSL